MTLRRFLWHEMTDLTGVDVTDVRWHWDLAAIFLLWLRVIVYFLLISPVLWGLVFIL